MAFAEAYARCAGGRIVLATMLLVVLCAPTRGQAPDEGNATTRPGDDAAWRAQMERRMENLEQENRELKAQAVQPPATQPFAGFEFAPRTGQVTPPDFDIHKYVAEGNFPGSIRIPNTNISIQVGGFAQVDAIFDNHQIGSKDSFIVSSIPTSNEGAGQTNFSVKQTRLFLKTEAPTPIGPLVTYVEGDFFSSSDTTLRLRHAWGEIGDKHQLLGGQTWTTFMDASTYPAIFDYQGPNGMVLVRQPMVRYTENFGEDSHWQISLEDPNPDLSSAPTEAGTGTAQLPDLASNVRWSQDWGHLQLAGILRELQFDRTVGHRSTELGWGLNFSGAVNVFRPVADGKQDNIVYQIAGGKGIANYFNDTSGLGLDGFLPAGGSLDALSIWGGFVAYQHYWTPKWASTVGYSYLHVYSVGSQPPGTYQSGNYVVANIMWYPVDRVWIGVEFLYGVRKDLSGAHGDDTRVSFSAQYRF